MKNPLVLYPNFFVFKSFAHLDDANHAQGQLT
jgi:hypothetical protein